MLHLFLGIFSNSTLTHHPINFRQQLLLRVTTNHQLPPRISPQEGAGHLIRPVHIGGVHIGGDGVHLLPGAGGVLTEGGGPGELEAGLSCGEAGVEGVISWESEGEALGLIRLMAAVVDLVLWSEGDVIIIIIIIMTIIIIFIIITWSEGDVVIQELPPLSHHVGHLLAGQVLVRVEGDTDQPGKSLL